MRTLASTRQSYEDTVLMSSHDFVEMMLLDGCFVIELLRHLGQNGKQVVNEDESDDPIFARPLLIPILIKDLLKLENQLPFCVLELLFGCSRNYEDPANNLHLLVLRVFDLAFPRAASKATLLQSINRASKHLLDVFYMSLLPPNQGTNVGEQEEYRPSRQSIQCLTQLRQSGIKFQSRKTGSFLDIKFHYLKINILFIVIMFYSSLLDLKLENRVLEIPTITINDFTSTLLINCIAWEQCHGARYNYFTDYVSFMSCLINEPRDVAFLCMDGSITRFSHNDQYVADLFNSLGQNVEFNIRNCYLSKQFRELEAYYSSNWATMIRTYFSSPWSFVSLLSAVIIIALTVVQTVISVLSYMTQTR